MYFLLESINRSRYELLENGIARIRKNPKDKHIEQQLNTLFNINVRVNIEDKPFIYGMMVYPSYEEIKEIEYKVLPSNDGEFMFDQLHSLYIDIDPKLLAIANDSECVAILLHEVGHKALSYDRKTIINAMTTSLFKQESLMKRFVIIKYAISSSIFLSPWFLRKEAISDSFAINCGYGEELQSGLDKVLKKYPEKFDTVSVMFLKSRLNQIQRTNVLITDDKEYREYIYNVNKLLLK